VGGLQVKRTHCCGPWDRDSYEGAKPLLWRAQMGTEVEARQGQHQALRRKRAARKRQSLFSPHCRCWRRQGRSWRQCTVQGFYQGFNQSAALFCRQDPTVESHVESLKKAGGAAAHTAVRKRLLRPFVNQKQTVTNFFDAARWKPGGAAACAAWSEAG